MSDPATNLEVSDTNGSDPDLVLQEIAREAVIQSLEGAPDGRYDFSFE